ncbi:MAG: hypothetical protein HKM24_07725 [Gammaproteobacteria bacterium]|nr:hypothetical protein [Gammaproteobacteria bacterium]
MCRQTITLTAQTLTQSGYDNGHLKLFNTFRDAASLADLDNATFVRFKQWMFDPQITNGQSNQTAINGKAHGTQPIDYQSNKVTEDDAWLLLELIKDVLYETFTRRAHLKQVIQSRQPATIHPKPQNKKLSSDDMIPLVPNHWAPQPELVNA